VITQVQYTDRAGVPQTPLLTDFTFGWTQPGGAAVPAVTTPNLDSVNFATIAAGVYQVIATRSGRRARSRLLVSSGKHRDQDKTLSPIVKLTPFSNTSCTVAFEGEIQVDVTDASKAKVPPVAFNYNYAWSDPNAAGLTLPAESGGADGHSKCVSEFTGWNV